MPYALDSEACKRWLPSLVWDRHAGWASDTEDCYFSDLYRARGRHTDSYEMAPYTAAIYCPQAPIDPMISSERGQKTQDILQAAMSSLDGQVARGQHVTKAVIKAGQR